MSISLRYLRQHESAQDALQETWINVFNNMDQYRLGTNLKSWLAKIVINSSLKQIRSTSKVRNTDELSVLSNVIIEDNNIESDLAYADLLRVVFRLSSPAREVFMMFVLDGMSHSDIGGIMGIKSSTSRVHLTNARKKLKEMLMIVNSTTET